MICFSDWWRHLLFSLIRKTLDNQYFRITNFYVGDMVGSKQVPVPFLKSENNHEVFLPIIRGQVRDIENNIVLDKTVIAVGSPDSIKYKLNDINISALNENNSLN